MATLAQLPELQQINIAAPLQAYYAGKQQRRNDEMEVQKMQLANRNMQLQEMKLQEYEQQAPMRALQQKLEVVAADQAMQEMGKQWLMNIDTESPDFDRQVVDTVKAYEQALVQRYNFTPEEAAHVGKSIITSGAGSKQGITQLKIKSGLMAKPETIRKVADGHYIEIGPDGSRRVEKLYNTQQETPQATPTDIDDFVADGVAQYKIDNDGNAPPPGFKNDLRLQFKRAQAEEVGAVKMAEREAVADTAEKISFNEKLGARLAEIQTEPAKVAAAGEITPEETKRRARVSVGGSLKALAGHYLNLDSMGAIVNTDKTSFENIVASLESSTLGQAAGKALGTEAQSIRNSINMIKPTLVQDIRKATEMGVRGMDSQKELEFYLQAATDEKRDIQANIGALLVLDQKYGDGTIAEVLKGKVNPAHIKRLEQEAGTAASEALPPGAKYGGINPETMKMEYFDENGRKL